MHSCPFCGLAYRPEDLISEIGDMITLRCSACSKESWATISRPLPFPQDETRVKAIVSWAGEVPTAQELIALRKVVVSFRDYGLTQVKEAVRGAQQWELGVIEGRHVVSELSESVRRVELSLDLSDIEPDL